MLAGCISLWRIAAKREQHSSIGPSMFALLIKVLRSDDPHVAVIGAAAVWCLAQEEATLRRLPIGKLVAALLHTYPAVQAEDPAPHESSSEGGGEEGEGGEGGEGGGGAVEAEEASSESGDEDSSHSSSAAAAEEFARHSDIVFQVGPARSHARHLS